MNRLEEGVLEPSQILFLSPSDFALETLYCLQHIGIFYCDTRYVVTHPFWESILVLFVDEGSLEVSYQNETSVATSNDVVIIDCRYVHQYRALENLKFHYFHFTGEKSSKYAAHITALNQHFIIRSPKPEFLQNTFYKMYRLAQSQAGGQNEYRISVYIQMILAELSETVSIVPTVATNAIESAISYMQAHVRESLTLDEIAEVTGYNKQYFSRHFKKYMGTSPHKYFLSMRMQLAKRLLLTTYDSVEQIAYQCGFDNTSNFIRGFKRQVGLTPTEFRKIPF